MWKGTKFDGVAKRKRKERDCYKGIIGKNFFTNVCSFIYTNIELRYKYDSLKSPVIKSILTLYFPDVSRSAADKKEQTANDWSFWRANGIYIY